MVQSKRKQSDLKLRSIFDPIALSDACKMTKIQRNKIWSYIIKHTKIDIDTVVTSLLSSSSSSEKAFTEIESTTTLFRLQDVPMEDTTFSIKRSDIRVLKDEGSDFTSFTSKVVETIGNSRQDTTKLLIELQDGHQVESVIIRHRHYSTLCVSSQIGCGMGCKFCATGTMGIIGDLTAGEIIEQYVIANSITPIRNVVFMGMGEPLNNYENVRAAISSLIDPGSVFSLSPRHITVSTVGVIKYMYKLTEDLPSVNLALSLHAPDQETRLKIVPTAGANKIDTLMNGIDNHIKNSKKNHKLKTRKLTVMMEYILIKDVNDTTWHAHALGKLLHKRKNDILLNLIPYNPTAAGESEGYKQPESLQINAFFAILTKDEFGYNLFTRLRHEMGQDVDAACGQLAVRKHGNTDVTKKDIESSSSSSSSSSSGSSGSVRDIEDFTTSPSLSPSCSSGYSITYFYDILEGVINMVGSGDDLKGVDTDVKKKRRGTVITHHDSDVNSNVTDGISNGNGIDHWDVVAASAVVTGILLASIAVYRAAKISKTSYF